jgi:tetratricopeptide (TPR) repeat protein
MAKQRQSAKSIAKDTRSSKLAAVKKGIALKRQAARKSAAPARKAASSKKDAPTPKKSSSGKDARRPAASTGKRRAAAQTAPAPVAAQAPAPPAVRKPGFYEAVAIYERGVQALQRHDYNAAAGFFRTILDKYPEERELLERARLYLRVCERETARQPAVPKTAAERVYAATVALNSGDHTGALDHLQRALGEEPDSDHAHYIMAVALGMRGRPDEALEHLRRAIGLNPDNRGLAREDPDLESIRNHESFGSALNTPPASNRRRAPRRT